MFKMNANQIVYDKYTMYKHIKASPLNLTHTHKKNYGPSMEIENIILLSIGINRCNFPPPKLVLELQIIIIIVSGIKLQFSDLFLNDCYRYKVLH